MAENLVGKVEYLGFRTRLRWHLEALTATGGDRIYISPHSHSLIFNTSVTILMLNLLTLKLRLNFVTVLLTLTMIESKTELKAEFQCFTGSFNSLCDHRSDNCNFGKATHICT